MEQALKDLFGLQFLVCDPVLQALIDDTDGRYGETVSEDELALLAAAGDPSGGWKLPSPEELHQ